MAEAQLRRFAFAFAMLAPESPLFEKAREHLAVEQHAVEEAEQVVKSYSMPTRSDFLPRVVVLALLVLATVVVPLVFGKLFILHGRLAGLSVEDLSRHWSGPYTKIAWSSWVLSTACGFYTSIFAAKKTWFSWDNFCITPLAWGSLRFTELGVAFIVAGPLALLWSAGHTDTVPAELKPDHYKAGAGRYALFLQTWSVLCFIVASLILLVWVKFLMSNEQELLPVLVYLLSGAGIVIPVVVILGRFIRNGFLLRHRYEELKVKQLAGGKPIIAEDPTRDFLGENWWALPASMAGMFGVIWAVLEWTGIMKVLGH